MITAPPHPTPVDMEGKMYERRMSSRSSSFSDACFLSHNQRLALHVWGQGQRASERASECSQPLCDLKNLPCVQFSLQNSSEENKKQHSVMFSQISVWKNSSRPKEAFSDKSLQSVNLQSLTRTYAKSVYTFRKSECNHGILL